MHVVLKVKLILLDINSSNVIFSDVVSLIESGISVAELSRRLA